MFRLLIRLAINAVAFWVVFNGIPGLTGGVVGVTGPQNLTAVIIIKTTRLPELSNRNGTCTKCFNRS